uniref:Putative serine/threonine-protein kinase n=1 Tax=Aegilops tauschii TaxID=37682 RepID=M8C7S5_AEGTA
MVPFDKFCKERGSGIATNTLRPEVPEECDKWWRSLMEQCWSNEPSERPTFTEIAKRLGAVASGPAKA